METNHEANILAALQIAKQTCHDDMNDAMTDDEVEDAKKDLAAFSATYNWWREQIQKKG